MSVGDSAHRHAPGSDWNEARQIIRARFADPRVAEALNRTPKINREFDIAYILGASNDLTTLYADRDFPLTDLPVGTERIDVTGEGWLHEIGEALFILLFGDHYNRAHRLITIAEHDKVVGHGTSWPLYKDAFAPYAKRDEHKRIRRSPPDLFLRPYQDSGDWLTLQRIRDTMV
jgi:hypothetical protein